MANPDKVKLYYLKHRDGIRAATAARRKANIEAFRARDRAWRIANVAKAKDAARRYRIANPKVNVIVQSRRRARKRGNGGSHTVAQWVALCWSSGWCCFYCATGLTEKTVVQEHRTPITRGGSDDIENIAVSCKSCNLEKGSLSIEEFQIRRASR